LLAGGQETIFRSTFGLNLPSPHVNQSHGLGKVTGIALQSHDYSSTPSSLAGDQKSAARYLPNGASSVGGAHRMAQTKTRFEGIGSPDMTIKEESHIADKD